MENIPFYKDWSFWLSISTVIIAVIALVQTWCEHRNNKRRQKQDTGLTLFPLRKGVLGKFSEKKYDEVFWDATILFSAEVSDEICNIAMLMQRLKELHEKQQAYINRMESDDPERYEEFMQIEAQMSCCESENLTNSLFHLCDGYKPIVVIPRDGSEEILDYRDLYTEVNRYQFKIDALHLEIFTKMKNEIKQSIA